MAVWCSSSRSTGGTALHGELQHERCGESTDGLDEPALVRGFSILLDMRGRSWHLYCQPPGIGGVRLAAGRPCEGHGARSLRRQGEGMAPGRLGG